MSVNIDELIDFVTFEIFNILATDDCLPRLRQIL